jgi:hypothetical protein
VTADDDIDPAPTAPDPTAPPARGATAARPQPGIADAFERIQPILAVVIMVTTFLLLPQPFAVALIGLVWLGTTRISRGRRFLGLTLTEALAWAATLVIAFLCLALALYSFGGTSQ